MPDIINTYLFDQIKDQLKLYQIIYNYLIVCVYPQYIEKEVNTFVEYH